MRCSFSGKDIPQGTGKMFVKKDGTVLWFASSKAEKNMLKLGRKANKTRWTEEAKETKKATLASLKHEQEAAADSSDAKETKKAPSSKTKSKSGAEGSKKTQAKAKKSTGKSSSKK